MNYNLRFTLDYEIHGNGDGNAYDLMVEPTYRLMDLLEKYHQRVTIMADVAEILCFKREEQRLNCNFYVTDIEEQLRNAIKRGHDVQLHVHSSYFNAYWNGKKFEQCIEEYNTATLPKQRIDSMLEESIKYLEQLLRPIKKDYKVWLFRAANWSMMPTSNLYLSLVEHGIVADTSVFKGGCQGGNVCYDYRNAFDNLLPYKANKNNINEFDENGELQEYPIYTEMRPFFSFITPIRVFRMIRAKFHKHKKNTSAFVSNSITKNDNRKVCFKSFLRLNPWKLDFNQASGVQLINAVKRIQKRVKCIKNLKEIDIVFIGHSKTFVPYNEHNFQRFLAWSLQRPEITKCDSFANHN